MLTNSFNRHFDSKRFVAMFSAMATFIVMIYTTKYAPIELATAISMMLAVYTGSETFKPSGGFTNITSTTTSTSPVTGDMKELTTNVQN